MEIALIRPRCTQDAFGVSANLVPVRQHIRHTFLDFSISRCGAVAVVM
jgi:hypothetical protein